MTDGITIWKAPRGWLLKSGHRLESSRTCDKLSKESVALLSDKYTCMLPKPDFNVFMTDSCFNSRIDTLGTTFTRPGLLSDSTLLHPPTTSLHKSVEQSYLGCPEELLDALRYFSFYRDILVSPEPVDVMPFHSYVHNMGAIL